MDKVAVNIIQGEKPVYFIDEKEIESIVKKPILPIELGILISQN